MSDYRGGVGLQKNSLKGCRFNTGVGLQEVSKYKSKFGSQFLLYQIYFKIFFKVLRNPVSVSMHKVKIDFRGTGDIRWFNQQQQFS